VRPEDSGKKGKNDRNKGNRISVGDCWRLVDLSLNIQAGLKGKRGPKNYVDGVGPRMVTRDTLRRTGGMKRKEGYS